MTRRADRELTGRTVLLLLIGFFALVAGVNAVMIRAATSTYGGVEVDSAYKAGLTFMKEVTAAREQDARHWTVDARFGPEISGERELAISVHDRNGAPVSAVEVAVRLVHPADARHDHAIAMRQTGSGLFKGMTAAEPAQWDLVIEMTRGGQRIFRSKSRIVLK